MFIEPKVLKDFILDSGLVSKKELENAELEAEKKGEDLGEYLVSSGKITEADYNLIKGHILGIPVVNLKDQKIDFAVLSAIPEPIARKHNIVAFRKTEKELEVAMLDPNDLRAIEFIKKRVGLKILPRLTDKESIKSALLNYQKSLKAEFGDIISSEAKVIGATYVSEGEEGEPDAGELKKLAEDVPIVRIVDSLLSHAFTQQASDIHMEPFEDRLLVRYRIDGILHDAMTLPPEVASGITARIKVLSNLRLDEKRLPQDGRFKVDSFGGAESKVSFRVSILPTSFGEKIVIRLLPESNKGFTLEALGFHGEGLERVHNAMKQTTGMILVTGPTGSGKTTTLYTIIDILNTPEVNISTIEDPVEYQMARVNQTQVKPEIGLTFASGLRALLRQDPNVIMVGEIRDKETSGLAINAALTGHLVLSTLHTNSAAGAIPRFKDMGGEPFLLVSTLNLVVAQRLVRKIAGNAEKYFLTATEIKALEKKADMNKVISVLKEENLVPKEATWEKISFVKPKQSEEFPSGYAGRVAIHEILMVTPAIRNMIIKDTTADEIEDQARKEGMLTLFEDGIYKAAQGLTSVEEVLRVANE
ncbi:MAG TPA: GspE/PulE family protein [Candidatus Paceibacterota bacterium]|nr:GspE/PulE family protein [Candidatus Paceibacterota bacterium]